MPNCATACEAEPNFQTMGPPKRPHGITRVVSQRLTRITVTVFHDLNEPLLRVQSTRVSMLGLVFFLSSFFPRVCWDYLLGLQGLQKIKHITDCSDDLKEATLRTKWPVEGFVPHLIYLQNV